MLFIGALQHQGLSWKEAFVEEIVLWDGLDWDPDTAQACAEQTRQGIPEYDLLFKMLLIGDSGVPKWSFLVRLCDDELYDPYRATIGIDFKIRTVQILNKTVKLQFWDTAGQERFRTITNAYFRGANGIFISFALNDRSSLESCTHWHAQIKSQAAETVSVILLGLDDGESERQVSQQLGRDTAAQLGCRYIEACPRTGSGVNRAAAMLVHDIMKTHHRLAFRTPPVPQSQPEDRVRRCALM